MMTPPFSRRQFIASSAAAIGAASLARLGASTLLADDAPPPAPAKPLGFAFVGLGDFATNHLMPGMARCKLCKIVALVSGHPDKAAVQAQKYGVNPKNIYNYDNYDSIKDNPDIDAVYIVLPNGMHAEYTIRAFAAGKQVMCEKPMANTAAECQQMIDAGKKAGKKLQIGYRMHWDAPTLACIDTLRKGTIGPIQIISAATGFTINGQQWRLDKKLAGGGCMMDIGIYSLSAARYFAGEEPTEVFAHTYQDKTNPLFQQVEQHCDFQLKFPGGALASCLSSYNVNFNRYTIWGNKGNCVIEPGQSYNRTPGLMVNANKFSLNNKAVPVMEADQFVGEMDGFAQVVAGAGPAKATGEEGLQDMRIIDAIYESAQSGKSVKL